MVEHVNDIKDAVEIYLKTGEYIVGESAKLKGKINSEIGLESADIEIMLEQIKSWRASFDRIEVMMKPVLKSRLDSVWAEIKKKGFVKQFSTYILFSQLSASQFIPNLVGLIPTDSVLKNGIYSLGKLPDLSKLDLHTLQYNLISFDGNSAPQFLHVYNFSSIVNVMWIVILNPQCGF